MLLVLLVLLAWLMLLRLLIMLLVPLNYPAEAACAAARIAARAVDYAIHVDTAARLDIWREYVKILDGALRIGKQAPDFEESEVRQSIASFEMARQLAL